jgi:hypothetical protein
MKTVLFDQGEVRIYAITSIPEDATLKPAEKCATGWIVSHSEQGHHHICTGGDVMERTNDVPAGMRILYAILEKPEEFIQDAPSPHEKHQLPAGLYEFRCAREYDPFAEQARQVQD